MFDSTHKLRGSSEAPEKKIDEQNNMFIKMTHKNEVTPKVVNKHGFQHIT